MWRKKPFRIGSACLAGMRACCAAMSFRGCSPQAVSGHPRGREKKSLLGRLCAYRAKREVLGGVRNAFLALDKTGCKSFFGQGG